MASPLRVPFLVHLILRVGKFKLKKENLRSFLGRDLLLFFGLENTILNPTIN
jgi:hypothetical protein